MEWNLRRYGTVGSTMDVAADLARSGAPEGTVVVAEAQTAGRGRSGRAWVSGPGASLQVTVVLRPGDAGGRLTVLPLALGLAAAEAVELVGGGRCWLKWPNDLWLGDRHRGRKVGGILVEAKADGTVLAGIGINVGQGAAHLPDGAASLALEGTDGDGDALLGSLLERVAARYAQWLAGGHEATLEAWTARAALLGQSVTVNRGSGAPPLAGTLTGVRDDGALLVETGDGGLVAVVAGDLARGPRLAAEARPGEKDGFWSGDGES